MSEKLSMRKITEMLRLKWDLKRSNREIAASIGSSNSTVSECVRRAIKANLSWPLPSDLDDIKLEALLYRQAPNQQQLEINNKIDWSYTHQELRRKGVTLQLLWYEHKKQFPESVSYSRYCVLYRRWSNKLDVCMRQNYKYGEKIFVDYAGMTVAIIVDVYANEVVNAQIFVAVLGASNFTYCEATLTQALPDWISSHVRAFNFFGGVSEILVSDNLKQGVTKAHKYEPDLNPAYCDMANHYGVAIIPTRVVSPKDKAKVEEAVQNVERSILARLRDRKFFSLYELNEAIKPLLTELNQKPFQKLPGSRLSQFETLEKPLLRPLPQTPYVFAEWKKAKAGIDYHVALDGHYYSVPFTFIQKDLDVRFTRGAVEIFYKNTRIASHIRSDQKGKFTTVLEHMPQAHQQYAKWTPERIIRWASASGKATAELVEKVIASRKHPQQGFRSCLGIMRLSESYGKDRVEKACQRALYIKAYSYKSVLSILEKDLDEIDLPNVEQQTQVTEKPHENLRGADYFAQLEQ
jgi:transposase